MDSSPASLDTSLSQTANHFRQAANKLVAVYDARKPAKSDQVTPPQLVAATEQFLTIITKLDKEEGEAAQVPVEDITQLGEYGLTLLLDLTTWANQLGQNPVRGELEQATLGVTAWILRHQGRLQTLEPIVNALASAANRIKEPPVLEQFAEFMSDVINQTGDVIKQDLEKSNPGRPWRLLHLNRAIVATRSHNPALMTNVFDELVRDFPEEVAGFFAQGMAQMDALNYPAPVREVMARYYGRFHTSNNRDKLH